MGSGARQVRFLRDLLENMMRSLTEQEQQILVAALKEHLYTLTIDHAAQSLLKAVNQIAEAVCFGLIVYDDDKEDTRDD